MKFYENKKGYMINAHFFLKIIVLKISFKRRLNHILFKYLV